MCVYVYVCMCAYLCIYMRLCVCVCVCVCVFVCVFACACVSLYMYTQPHERKHAHTGPWLRDKVVCVTAEAFVFGYEPGYHTAQELVDYMISQGFRLWDQRGGNYLFVNSALQAWLPLVDCYTQ